MFFKGEVLILIIIGAFDVKRGGFDTCSKRGGFDTSKKYQNFQKISLTTSNIWCIINLAVNDSVFSNEKSSALIKNDFRFYYSVVISFTGVA